MPLAPAVSTLARQTMRTAFEELERTVTPADSRTFRSTTLQHVRAAALELENQLAARQSLCNMRRLAPLLNGLGHYARVVDILCNGTPFLPWVWAPITMILRVASEYLEAFEQIMKGYGKIAESLRRFDILNEAFIAEPDFQQTLAVFYADILQFHKHAYKFVRRSGWRLLFLTSWGRFQGRFDNILQDLDRHGNLIDQEANALNIAAASQMRQEIRTWREESLEDVKRTEERQAIREFQSILSWLKVDETEQIQIFETISDEGTKFPGTCSWLTKNEKIKAWLQKRADSPLLWLQGNPGCGKSVIAAKLVDFLQASKSPIIHHFCTYTYASSTKYDGILRSLLQQLLRKSGELTAHVYQECIVNKHPPTTANLERLIETLIAALSDEPRETQHIWIIIDGINECEPARQGRLVNLMNIISSISSSALGTVCKVLVTTRPSPIFNKSSRKNNVIFLSDESSPLQSAIRTYVSQRLRSLHDRFRQMELESEEIEEIELLVSKKAGGMFLYARLVLDFISAELFYSGDELKTAINQLPETLAEFYQKLLAQILARLSEQSQDRVRCILSWIAFAKRPLKKLEFLSALTFTTGDSKAKKLVPRYILEETCSPLIEERRDTTLAFIHVSVKHFLQSESSAMILNEEDALREHGVAAISCLLSGLEVFKEEYNRQERLLRLIKGLHGFHVYATEYWIEYLLANANMRGGLEANEKLLRLATILAEQLENKITVPLPKFKTSSGSIDERLGLLKQHRTIQQQVEKALLARSQSSLESALLHKSATHAKEKPTSLNQFDGISIALNSYQSAVRSLLDEHSVPGASVEELELFKSQFRTSAYTCRLRLCPRATIGFASQKLRDEHEVAHAGGFRCTFVGCQYPPFRSSKALVAHTNATHSLIATPPRQSIRRVGRLRLTQESTTARSARSSGDRSAKLQDNNHVNPSAIQTSLPAKSNQKRRRSRSASLPLRTSPKSKKVGAACLACTAKNIRCNKAQPTCATCKRWSRVCTYPDACEQCIAKDLQCDKNKPVCKSCKSQSMKCSYDEEELPAHPVEMEMEMAPHGELSRERTLAGETNPFGTDTLGSSGVSVAYLEIILNALTGGNPVNVEQLERVKDMFVNDVHACWDLSMLVDLTADSVDNLDSKEIISRLSTGRPELRNELERFLPGDMEPQDDMTDYEHSDAETEVGTPLTPIQHCFCNKESTGTSITCDNYTCPRGWFHLHCVNLVVTPYQNERWFCSDECRQESGKFNA